MGKETKNTEAKTLRHKQATCCTQYKLMHATILYDLYNKHKWKITENVNLRFFFQKRAD